MAGLPVLVFLIFISAIPAIVVYFWFRLARYPFSLLRFLFSLLAGAAAFFPALLLQYFFSLAGGFFSGIAGKWGLFGEIFIHIAFTEELSRFILLFILFLITARFKPQAGPYPARPGAGPVVSPELSYGDVTAGSAAGLAAGLGFAILESAAYGASNANIALLRTFTAAPLHGACGSRIGAAAIMIREHPVQALFRFFAAVAIHGIYNFMIILPGFPSITAVIIALAALASSILFIHGGMGGGNKPAQ
jgi:RsiW-degrading membrane proteinase PrsW (M82 family)